MALQLLRAARAPVSARSLSSLAASADFPTYVLNQPTTSSSKLANGVTVASEAGAGDTATISVLVAAGSAHEGASGAANLLGNLSFKGTGKRSGAQLAAEIEGMGGHLTSTTGRETTLYTATVGKADVPAAVEVLGDVLLNPKVDEASVAAERAAVCAQLAAAPTDVAAQVQDMLFDTAFHGVGLGAPAVGTAASVANLTAADVNAFRDNFTGSRIVVSGAGAVDHAQLVDLAGAAFGGAAAGAGAPPTAARFCGSDIRLREDDHDYAHVAVGFESAPAGSAHAVPLMMMQAILGSWDRTSAGGKNFASKLAAAAGEDELCLRYNTFNHSFSGTGLFGVQAVCEQGTVQDMMWNIMDGLVSLVHVVTEEEVARAQTAVKAQIMRDLNGTAAISADIARQMMENGRRNSAAEMLMRVDACGVEQVQATAEAVIHDKCVALAGVGPIHEMPDYNWVRRRTFWLRY